MSNRVGEVAEEASALLDKLPHAGEEVSHTAIVSPPSRLINAEQTGQSRPQLHGMEWQVCDYREELGMTESLVATLGIPEA